MSPSPSPDTSRKPKAGERESRMFAFTSRSLMEADLKAGRFLEHGEYDGNLYATKSASIHEVVEAGRICILDVSPQVGTPDARAHTLMHAFMGTHAHTHAHIQTHTLVLCTHYLATWCRSIQSS